jgi:hypothetical protein
MTSNIVESVNSVTKATKGCPVEPLLESLRYLLQQWFVKHINDAQATFTTLATTQEKKLREKSVESKKLKVPSYKHVVLLLLYDGISILTCFHFKYFFNIK